ncbi:unnamed protein product [Hydatigera taeniaeformis]|uniref:Troponin I n=1 Tax=Hydatigena taeniaeformis TaxID=6205 RepID=A0A0R3WJY5_HYDTA|nr:unnamed protein product [Hydatigera taeniaeformis]
MSDDESRSESASESEEKAKREAEEAAKKQRKPGQKRKGLGGLSPEKKRLLKQLIMQKAADEMKAEMKKRQEEKDNYLRSRVQALQLDGLDDGNSEVSALLGEILEMLVSRRKPFTFIFPSAALAKKVRELHARVAQLEGEKYDWEVKLRRQDIEINELTMKVNDVKGKFVKPVLKKVSKTESQLARIEKKEKTLASFRTQLKSTGQNKFALEEKDEASHVKFTKVDFRDQLKPAGEGEAPKEAAEE